MIVMRQTAGGVVVDGRLVALRIEDGGAPMPEPEAPPSVEDEEE
ncbi:hypothetical protein GCM10007897_41400 [Sphingobium jiangsuense]|uniref:Uncharacterized protein n=1 Tax=Sphingobium jiangsuense TaxID=870476 RepID=A0A7W6BIV8_9SPHN|nr:hypothetical protein [Sphingobium jiangsuense]MBB3927815.1 hypothetical protein [Sphingobium jiangsuense]GLT02718.1 hypothetical protein GCM10007897_41400 [Sphingobium jiangsuense]